MFIFKDFNYLTDGEIDLKIESKIPDNSEKGYVPSYKYKITLHNSKDIIGYIDIRIGNNENTYYGGNIGYMIKENYRGNGYASKACKLVKNIALAHELKELIITCNPDNFSSRRTCEKTGLIFKGIVHLPKYNAMYKCGETQKCIYKWTL